MTDKDMDSKIDEILRDLVFDTPNHYGYPPDFEPDFDKAKASFKNLLLEARLDEQSHTQADIDGNVEYWPNGVEVKSQLERLAELQSQLGGKKHYLPTAVKNK